MTLTTVTFSTAEHPTKESVAASIKNNIKSINTDTIIAYCYYYCVNSVKLCRQILLLLFITCTTRHDG